MHKEIYDFIHQETIPISIHTLTEKFPFLPINLLNETLKIHEPLIEYSHPPPIPQTPPLYQIQLKTAIVILKSYHRMYHH